MSADLWTAEDEHEVANRLFGMSQAVRALGQSADMADTLQLAAEMLGRRPAGPRGSIGENGPEAILPLTPADGLLVVHTPLAGGPSRVFKGARAPSSPSAPQARR